jgi:hypothetical protein
MIGGKMVIEVKAKNESNVERDLKYVGIFVAPTSYTGARGDTFFKKYFGKSSLKPGEGTYCCFSFTFCFNLYL